MATAPSDPGTVTGRVDRAGRLIAADAELAALQMEAGATIGGPLALPQIAAVARLARKLGIPVSRPALAAGSQQDVEMMVRAVPHGDEVALTIENWAVRPAASPRLATILGGEETTAAVPQAAEWAADQELRLTALACSLAEKLGGTPEDFVGQPLTRVFRLEENDDGEMPLIMALAARQGFAGQSARPRSGDTGASLVLSGDVVFAHDGSFDGFSGHAVISNGAPATEAAGLNAPLALDEALDEALRSPLDRIIDCAERIAERADGPLRNDYATYASDISAAARHLLSVIQAMSDDPGQGQQVVDLAEVAAEAVVLLEAQAEERDVRIAVESTRALVAHGEERPVIQILVNLIGNAVRHSPAGGTVTLRFLRGQETASVVVSDQGPGISVADQQRIFERFERGSSNQPGTGLGLAISRRLARSMGGDITLESRPNQGASFTLSLPAAYR